MADLSSLTDAQLEALASGGTSASIDFSGWSDADLAQIAGGGSAKGPGVLSNSADDGWISGAAKGTATGIIQGAGDVPGVFGNIGQLYDDVAERALKWGILKPAEWMGALPEGKTAEDMVAAAKELSKSYKSPAEQEGYVNKIFGVPFATGDGFASPILEQTGEYRPTSIPGQVAKAGVRAAAGTAGLGSVGSVGARVSALPAIAPKALAANFGLGATGETISDATGDPLLGVIGTFAAQKAKSAIGPRLKPYMETLPDRFGGNRQGAADRMLLENTADPQKVIADSIFQPEEIVPGSKPTLGEQTIDPGLLRAQNLAQTEAAPFQQNGTNTTFDAAVKARQGESNVARRSEIDAVAPPNADQMAPSRLFQRQLDTIDKSTQAAVDRISQGADQLNSTIPGRADPMAVGSTMRETLQGALDKATEIKNRLYKAIDPEGKINVVSAYARRAAQELKDAFNPSVEQASPYSAPIIDMVAKLPDVMSLNDLVKLDSTITGKMSEAKRNGDYTGHRELVQLKSSVMGAINDAIDNQAKYDAEAVRAGQLSPDATLEARLRANWIDEPADLRDARVSGYPQTRGGSTDPATVAPLGDVRAESEAGGGTKAPSGNQGVSSLYDAKPGLSEFAKPPPDIMDAIRQFGGIKDIGGDLKAMGLDKQRGVVNNKTGLPPDTMREYLAEAGYLGADTNAAMANTTIADMLNRVDQHLNGNKVFSVHDEDVLGPHRDYVQWKEQKGEYQNAAQTVQREFDRLNAENNIPAQVLDKSVVRDATRHMVHDGLPWDDALERATIDLEKAKVDDAIQRERASNESRRVQEETRFGKDANRTRKVGEGYPEQRDSGSDRVANADAEVAARIRDAKDAHAELAQTYRNGPVAGVLKTNGFRGQYTTPDATIPGKVFVPGDKGYQQAKTFIDAAKGAPEAIESVKDMAINKLRDEMKSAPRLTEKALEAWKRKHAEALRAVDEASPGFSDQFNTAAKATEMVVKAEGARTQALKAAQDTAAADFIGLTSPAEVSSRVGKMLQSAKGPTEIAELVNQAKGDQAVIEGLRRAGVDHLLTKFSNAGTSGGESVLSGAKLRKYVDQNGDALTALYGKEGTANFRRVAADLERSQQAADAIKTVGSDTASKATPIFNKLLGKHAVSHSIGTAMLLGGMEAFHEYGIKGALAVGSAVALKTGLAKLHASGVENIQQLYLEGLLNPAVGRAMLQRATENGKMNVNGFSKLADAVASAGNREQEYIRTNAFNQREYERGYAEGGAVKKDDKAPEGPVLRPFEPSWRDRIGAAMFDATSGSPVARNLVSGLVGSTGLGSTGMSVADLVPGVGQVLGGQEAAHEGDYRGAAMQAMFLGPSAKIANKVALAQAEKLAAGGADRAAIWNQTGWFKGPDGNWRFEIPDNKASVSLPSGSYSGPVSGALDHPDLYNAYPKVGAVDSNVRVTANRPPSGSYETLEMDGVPYGNGYMIASGRNPDELKSAMLHEGQHVVQRIEGSAVGGSPGVGERAPFIYKGDMVENLQREKAALEDVMKNAPYGSKEFDAANRRSSEIESLIDKAAGLEGYRRLAGEVEARNVQKRMDMTPEQRQATPPWLTQDVPDEQQIVRKGGGNALMQSSVPVDDNALAKGITAYHGSPHSFDRFSLDKIGTGEGAQAYGHGLYFAQSEDVAK
ncbi:hypothetical protein UFOVP473_1, partial [uncultured Caudovirales phage]